jgi:hypothetical protein
MPSRRSPALAAVSALAIIASAPAALADVTAAEVWANWKALMEASGPGSVLSVGAEETAGSTLTVRDLTLTQSDPDMTMVITYGTHVFEELGDGTVRVILPPSYTIAITGTAPAPTMTVVMEQTGTDVLVSGTGDDLTTAYTAGTINVALRDMVAEGAPVDVQFGVTMTNVAASYSTVGTDALDITSRFTADEMALTASGTPPEPDQGPFALTARFAKVEGEGSGLMGGTMFATPDMSAALAAGFRFDTVLRHGTATYEAETNQPAEGRVVLRGGSDSGNLSMRMGPDGFSYGGGNTGLTLSAEVAALPLPDLSASIAETAFNVAAPVQPSDTPQDFGMLLRLKDLVVSDTIWNLADPGSIMPRDPATLILDVAGKANWVVDVLSPEVAAQPMDGAPGEIHAFDIRALELTAVGASLTGTGAFTFDNTDLATFDGVPRPQGGLDLRLAGGNALIDRLSQMGLLPPDQVMAAQMILGLFARPTGEPDVVTSRIEVDPSGTILANGQPLPMP